MQSDGLFVVRISGSHSALMPSVTYWLNTENKLVCIPFSPWRISIIWFSGLILYYLSGTALSWNVALIYLMWIPLIQVLFMPLAIRVIHKAITRKT